MSRKTSVINWVAEVDASGNVQHLERVDTFEPAAAVAFAVPAQASAPVNNNASARPSRAASIATTPEPAPKSVEPAPAAYQFTKAPEAAPESQPRLVPASLRTTESEREPAAPSPSSEQAAAVPATIVGCLGQTENTFWLKNVSGDDAPKSRSWKSGFLKKKSNSIELIDDAKISRLGSYVGKRVEATGVLDEREMHVKALRVQGDCD